MYQVLYRKWRPRVFADVAGQPQVTITLKNELQAGRVGHAYLFTGSRGTGKTTCAKILAKAVNCLESKDGDPCGACESCRGLDSGAVMDVVEIDAASNNGVDSIRSLREEANFTPNSAKYRVYIIDEVHMLSVGAFNALLKTLEEPPAHVIFILATTEAHKLPATILSRCQRFDFRRIPPEDIAARLEYVAEQEGAALDSQAALLLARLADGALRDALSLLDQCLGNSKTITTEVVNETAGLAGRGHLLRIAEAVRNADAGEVLKAVDELHNDGKDMARLCEELSAHYRSLMLIKTMKDARGVLALPESEYREVEKQALAVALPVVLHCLTVLQAALEQMYRGGDRRIEMEMGLIKLCSPALDTAPEALARRLDALERGALPAKAAAAEAAPIKKAAPIPVAPVKAATPIDEAMEDMPEPIGISPAPPERSAPPASKPARDVPPGDDAEEHRLAEWPEILQQMKAYSMTIFAAFTGSAAYVRGDYILIDAKETAFELLRRPTQREKMREAILQVTGRVYRLGPHTKPEAEDAAEDDPLKALAGAAAAAGVEVVET